ncbi:LacI family DNA-binding transcriptional regulator [Streptomonospora wellingtoniae]|uniref:LacI family DNA-binding transcriptional regulator n=1 Tax=Streptomonospora wellingtoniae TaxID=3075544 RepID=A0ABU2KRN6_9ACTN|nr:LacI family DNA-binding transcriptional regulator [Streptomonospora sp. DSM 45055]MDT0301778.1 LacI family DNA-binding transcriptional regulator [Streptomonospora sp. DSM 45055]
MGSRPRIKDVARRAGVSEKTVSNVINDYPHVTAKTRAAVEAAVAELGYRVNLAGRQLRRGESGVIALVIPELDLGYFAELSDLVIREAERHSRTVLVHQTEAQREREAAALDGFGTDFVDGVIFSPLAMDDDDLSAYSARLPVVLLGEVSLPGRHDHAAIDNVAAAREATEHLLERGRRRIAVVGGRPPRPTGTAELRTRGYSEAVRAHGLDYDPALVRSARRFHWQDGADLAAALMAEPEPPDALLCLNDLLALGAVRALHTAGVRVPEDVAVVGFDDVTAGRFAIPSLTTVAPDKPQLAREAVRLLLRAISADRPSTAPQAVEEVVIGHTLVVRESTGGTG